MAKPFLSVIIPAYNEADRLPLTLIDVDRHLSEQEYSYEIIVVNDGSTDSTAEIARRFISLIPNLKLLDNPTNQGKGLAVKQGMLSAKGNWRLFMDADNSTSVVEFNKMMPYLSAGGGSIYGKKETYDVIIGSRSVRGARKRPGPALIRWLLDKFNNLAIQLLLLRGVWDTQCGFKCFSEAAADRIFPLIKIDRWGFDIEALALAKVLGYKIKEMPIFWSESGYSHVRLSDHLQILWEAFKIRWWLWRGKYENLEFRS
ncbi:MAG: hypothetical protein A2745_03415 [Candidatus Harrisonbacteria bacterium RIFCSPHIGHO2_01_FULL_44_13]|uniref:dolichyl-phosphate beta-glucosyltransferase n=1 Tax=Candidatus Harrisonbacteria bacterium RIFCSPLOWO2_01_FULL_44_18 TaxID=1798407 RepID=A0A1G1ZMT0_9BACT|nr:MAG: hypothetical protein A2745_03415 [Candidatus Harrisonbacteria bacterium RIFCSPHIGHO2_01_FULL_44_13]OGY65968.1 MAG: hypothetical protein A3A16_01105 [Candidatus Harrisonbacteria bacterium RIFCSPLOWO2_01_FULL_44_18]